MAEKHTLQPKQLRIETFIEVAVHVLAWSYIFISPLFFKRRGEIIDWHHYIHGSLLPITLCVSFYLNYFIFVPRFLLNKEKRKWFFICNVLIFCVYQFGIELQASLLAPMNKSMVSPRGGWIGPRPERWLTIQLLSWPMRLRVIWTRVLRLRYLCCFKSSLRLVEPLYSLRTIPKSRFTQVVTSSYVTAYYVRTWLTIIFIQRQRLWPNYL